MKNSYMHSDRVKQMEDIGVKVALGAIQGYPGISRVLG